MIQFTNLYDFHAVVLSTTFLLGAFYFILVKKWWLVILFLILAGITKEEVWSITAIFGLYILFVSKERILGGIITSISIILFLILFWVAIPNAAAGQHFALNFLSSYGETPGEVIKNIILNPLQVIQDITTPEKLNYLRQILMPLGFLSLIAFPFLIFAAPDLLINLLSGFTPMHQIWYQYTATITPFIFISAIYAAKLLNKYIPRIKYSYISIFLLVFTLYSAYTYGPMFFSKDANSAWYKLPLENRKIINDYIDKIPDDINVSASNSVGSHMSQRSSIFVIPKGIEEADLVIFLLRNPNQTEQEIFTSIKNNSEFELEFQDKDFYVFKRIE